MFKTFSIKLITNWLSFDFRYAFISLLLYNNGQLAMACEAGHFPPLDFSGEEEVSNTEFENRCRIELDRIMGVSGKMVIANSIITRNIELGLVCRYDFDINVDYAEFEVEMEDETDAETDGVNRIMLWELPSGNLATFIGCELKIRPLRLRLR